MRDALLAQSLEALYVEDHHHLNRDGHALAARALLSLLHHVWARRASCPAAPASPQDSVVAAPTCSGGCATDFEFGGDGCPEFKSAVLAPAPVGWNYTHLPRWPAKKAPGSHVKHMTWEGVIPAG